MIKALIIFSKLMSPIYLIAGNAVAILIRWYERRGRSGAAGRITRLEALRIVRQIMERAEKERLRLAIRKVQRGIRWEKDDDDNF